MRSHDYRQDDESSEQQPFTPPTVSSAEARAQNADDQARELAVVPGGQAGTHQDARPNQNPELGLATPYLGTFEIPGPDQDQEHPDQPEQPSARVFFPVHAGEKDFDTGNDDTGLPRGFRDDGPSHRAYTRQLLQAQHFRSISDTTSIVAVLIAALPWSLISQPMVPPTNFRGPTAFTFAALSSSLSVVLALLCQFAKLLYTLRPPGESGFRTTMVAYILEDVAQLALLQLGLVAILFFFLCMSAYSLAVGYIFVAITALAILMLTGWWIIVFTVAMRQAFERFQAKTDEMSIPPGQRRGFAVWRRVLFAMAQPDGNNRKTKGEER